MSATPIPPSPTPISPNPEEEQYLTLVRTILTTGQHRADRTGTGTLSLFAPPSLRFSLSRPHPTDPAGKPTLLLPLLTTKRVFTRGITEELLWFIKGSTNSKELSEKGVHIWDGNGSREYLDRVGLGHREEGDLGPVYGFQWRHFGATYGTWRDDYRGLGVDQLGEVVRKIRETPMDRRIILSAWNPADLHLMALPPCHMFCQFYVTLPPPSSPSSTPSRLSCLMYQRSADLGLGVPFNIASYALLLHMIARVTGTVPHELIMQFGDAHVYKDHVEPLGVQLGREPFESPEFEWRGGEEREREVREGGMDAFRVDDFEVKGYRCHSKIEMKMSV